MAKRMKKRFPNWKKNTLYVSLLNLTLSLFLGFLEFNNKDEITLTVVAFMVGINLILVIICTFVIIKDKFKSMIKKSQKKRNARNFDS